MGFIALEHRRLRTGQRAPKENEYSHNSHHDLDECLQEKKQVNVPAGFFLPFILMGDCFQWRQNCNESRVQTFRRTIMIQTFYIIVKHTGLNTPTGTHVAMTLGMLGVEIQHMAIRGGKKTGVQNKSICIDYSVIKINYNYYH